MLSRLRPISPARHLPLSEDGVRATNKLTFTCTALRGVGASTRAAFVEAHNALLDSLHRVVKHSTFEGYFSHFHPYWRWEGLRPIHTENFSPATLQGFKFDLTMREYNTIINRDLYPLEEETILTYIGNFSTPFFVESTLHMATPLFIIDACPSFITLIAKGVVVTCCFELGTYFFNLYDHAGVFRGISNIMRAFMLGFIADKKMLCCIDHSLLSFFGCMNLYCLCDSSKFLPSGNLCEF